MKYSKSLHLFATFILPAVQILLSGCPGGSGTTTAGNAVSANGKVSMTVAANPMVIMTNKTTTVTATVTNLQRDGITWQPAIDARVLFTLRPYPGNNCGSLTGPTTVQTNASGVATVTFKASNAPITTSVDTCYVYVIASRTFSVGTDANVSDSITLKIY